MSRQFISIITPGLLTITALLTGLLGVFPCPAADFTAGPVRVYVSAKDTGQRLTRIGDLAFTDLPQNTEKQECIFVDPSREFQTVLGIGGALTDAAAETFYKMPEAK